MRRDLAAVVIFLESDSMAVAFLRVVRRSTVPRCQHCLEQIRVIPRRVDAAIAKIMAAWIAQPLLREMRDHVLFTFIKILARR